MIDFNQLCREPSKVAAMLPFDLVPSIQARVAGALLALSARLEWDLTYKRKEAYAEEPVSSSDRFVGGKEAPSMLGVTSSWLHSNAWRLPFAFRLGSYGEYAPLRFSAEGIQEWRQYLKQELESGGKSLRAVVRTKDFALLSRADQETLQSQPRLQKVPKPPAAPQPRWDMIAFNEPWRLEKRFRITIEEAAAIMGEDPAWIRKRCHGTGHNNRHGLFFLRLSAQVEGGFDVSYADFMRWLQYRRSRDYPNIKARELRERWNIKR
jgi:hypothetical protein